MIAPLSRFPQRCRAAIRSAMLGLGISCLVLLWLTACSRPAEDAPAELVAEDVGGTIEIPIEDDVQEVRRPQNQLSGVLPSDFPADVPLSLPASLVDFGPENDPWVELATSRTAADVSAELTAGLRSKGWTVERTDGAWTARLDGRSVRVTVDGRAGGAVYRIDY
ncbi:MAG: hypothetical protein AAGE94_23920 [Acidobacteriota bacterium]